MQDSLRERAILLGVELNRPGRRGNPGTQSTGESSLQELAHLAQTAGAQVVSSSLQQRERLEAATLLGSGKVEELARMVAAEEVDVVIVDREVSPTQQRNLENALDCRVVDRTQLILDIFASRARTREGQLQVELAQLNYLLPRLTGRGVSMSRLGGGIGTRGPGETQLETDRRRIFRRIRKIEEQLRAVRSSRSIQRRQRQAVPLATIALIGYTNAGKSTLFNRLTGAEVVADSRLFATLDPTVRHILLPSNRRTLLSDTVGFIRNLPTTLVQAFRATLEEVREAALLLHVIDAASPEAVEQAGHVSKVLAEIEATSMPQLLVLNKIDLLEAGAADTVRRRLLSAEEPSPPEADEPRLPLEAVCVSARTGAGLDQLLGVIDALLPIDALSRVSFRIPLSEGGKLHLLHEFARVVRKRYEADYCLVEADVPESLLRKLQGYVIGTTDF